MTAPRDADRKAAEDYCGFPQEHWIGEIGHSAKAFLAGIAHERARVKELVEALRFYADWHNYSVDYDTSQAGVSRRVILYSDQEEINDSIIHAGKRAREVLKRLNEEEERG